MLDERGELYEFTDIEGNFRQVNILASKAGTVRGRHYHKKLQEKFFIIQGSVDVTIRNQSGKVVSQFSCGPNDQFMVKPYKEHTLTFLEDTIILSFYSEVFDQNDPDIHTLP